MTALLMGIVGFGLGLFFGWILHRERVGGAGSRAESRNDRATSALAGTSARLEEADQDVVELRTQLTDAQHMLDESAAAIADLEQQLAECRGEDVDETLAVGTDETLGDQSVDAAADEATTPPALTDAEIDEADVTEEVVVAERVDEVPDPDRTQQDLSVVYDETEAIPVQRGAGSGSGTDDRTETIAIDETESIEVPVDRTETIAVDETEAIPAQNGAQTGGSIDDTQTIAVDQTETIERPSVEEPAGADEPADDDTTEDVVVAEAPVAEPVAPAVDESAGDGAVVAGEGFVPPPDADHDRLQRIRGVGPAMERLLNEQGIVTFRQLAVLDDAGIEQLQSRLPGFSGRIRRDRWVEQARELHLETHGDQP